jgi:D-alanyl-D-alanine carboxypeptidase/D-alanyl-D-alanine-endopeptidase (penicillin-binding protein 4)
VIQDEWKNSTTNSALNIYDGSGLSPANRVTSLALANVLYQAQKQSWFPAFYESLPIHNMQKMKSGTIADVLAYAGYQKSANNSLCFSVIVNNYSGSENTMRQQLFNLLDVLK